MDSELILQAGDVIRIGERALTILAVQRNRIVVSVDGEEGTEEFALAPSGQATPVLWDTNGQTRPLR